MTLAMVNSMPRQKAQDWSSSVAISPAGGPGTGISRWPESTALAGEGLVFSGVDFPLAVFGGAAGLSDGMRENISRQARAGQRRGRAAAFMKE